MGSLHHSLTVKLHEKFKTQMGKNIGEISTCAGVHDKRINMRKPQRGYRHQRTMALDATAVPEANGEGGRCSNDLAKPSQGKGFFLLVTCNAEKSEHLRAVS